MNDQEAYHAWQRANEAPTVYSEPYDSGGGPMNDGMENEMDDRELRIIALQQAMAGKDAPAAEVVARARVYAEFLKGGSEAR